MQELDINRLIETLNNPYNLLDLRDSEHFSSGFITQSIFLGPKYQSIPFLSEIIQYPSTETVWIIPVDDKKGLIDNLPFGNYYFRMDISYFERLLIQFKDLIIQIPPAEFALDYKFDKTIEIIDLRSQNDFKKEYIKESVNVSLDELALIVNEYEGDDKIYLIGKDGDIALTAASILKTKAFEILRPVSGGYKNLDRDLFSLSLQKKKK